MSMTDTIADMLTRIRNGHMTRLMFVSVPFSRTKCDILNVLKAEGYITGYDTKDVKPGIKEINVALKYSREGMPAIKEIKRVSKPGKRTYTSISDLRGYFNGMGTYILSTSKGVLSDRDARSHNVGGEVICKVF